MSSLLIGILILIAPKLLHLRKNINTYLLLGIYYAFIVLKFITFGLPAPLIPRFGEIGNAKIIHIATLINDFTPIIYFGIKVGIGFLLFTKE